MRARIVPWLLGIPLALGAAVGVRALVSGGGVPGAELSPEALLATAKELVALGPAAEGHASKDAVQARLQERLRKAGASVQALPFSSTLPDGTRWELVNVLGSFHPQAKRRILLGTHWDTRPWADEDPDPSRHGQPIQGANDGGSGTAVLLELADALGRAPPPASLGVDLVFFDGEEGPRGTDAYFLGSRHLAESWFTTGLATPSRGVVLDMVGKKGLAIRRERASEQGARAVNDELFALARARGSRVFSEGVGPAIGDDHVAFLRRGIPVALLIDLDYPAWHTHADTLEALDPAAMDEVGEVVLAWLRAQGTKPH